MDGEERYSSTTQRNAPGIFLTAGDKAINLSFDMWPPKNLSFGLIELLKKFRAYLSRLVRTVLALYD